MPSNKQRVFGVVTTGLIIFGGAWLASTAKAQAQEASAPIAAAAQNTTLTATISGVRNARGKVYVIVFDDAQAYAAYDYDKAVGFKEVQARRGSVTASFPDLQQGPYAIAVFHDENGNQDMDMQGGYPSEGYGTSRANRPEDELSFQQASVPAGNVTVKVHYLQ